MKMAESDTKRYSLEELREMRERGETKTNADAPELRLDADFWRGARVLMPPRGKSSVHLRVDTDVLEWFKAQGRGPFEPHERRVALVHGSAKQHRLR
jgi:uncharacterized protein (DUF4415 family)